MGTVRLGAFPSLNNKGLQDGIANTIMQWFIHFFPSRFFSHVFLDTQVSNASAYIVNNEGQFVKAEPGHKILQPALRINIKQGMNNVQDVFGSLWNPNQQPGAFTIDTDLTGYKPFVYDPNGVILATNEYTIKNTIDINVNLQTKADQLAFFNICDTNIKNLYVNVIEAEVGIILPSLLMEYLRDTLFARELKMLKTMISGDDEKAKYRTKINEMFSEWLYKWSNKCIKPVVEKDENGVTTYLYKLFRKQRLTIHLDKPDGDDGNKKGGTYLGGFNVTFSGYVEYANPVTFISQVPAILRGMKNDYFINTSSNVDTSGNYHFMEFKEVFRDDRRLVFVDNTQWHHFYFEREIMMAKTREEFNMIGEVITEKDTPSHYYIIKALMSFVNSKEDFDNLFQIVIYKNNDSVPFKVDKDFNITIENCDLNVPYYIDVFIKRTLYQYYMKRIKDILYKNGLLIDPYESNLHIYRRRIKHLNGASSDTRFDPNNPYKGKYLNDSPYGPDGKLMSDRKRKTIDSYLLDELHAGDRGYYYITKNKDGTINNKPETFVPIKTMHFCKASDQWKYYVQSDTGSFIEVDGMVLEQRDDLQFYIQDNGEYVRIKRESVLIPDPEYSYFVFDRESRNYKICEDLESFDPKTQYYIPFSQHKTVHVDAGLLK